jgi:pimeloyl-ACP methyl ester carboxylesterase
MDVRGSDDIDGALNKRGRRRMRWAIAETDFRSEVRALRVPVTVINGDRDVSAPLELCGRRTAALASDAELLVYEDVAHGPMVTHAELLVRDVVERVFNREGRGRSVSFKQR